ncbi:MAG: MBL fold metallo-hydrolase [Candidatus Woesearchaeota archaeon]
MIEIFTIGGFSEFGRNMTAVRIDDDVIIIDMGIHMENFIRIQGNEDIENATTKQLLEHDVIPHYRDIDHLRGNVRAIIPTHAHLDHIGAIPFLAKKYNAEVLCTPFTGEVLKAIYADRRQKIKNDIRFVNPNSSFKVTKDLSVDFINVTHSTPQTIMLGIRTKYGKILYANDFKFDMSPTLGPKPNFVKMKDYEGALCLISDCTRAWDKRKTPSESVAKEMLKDVLSGTASDNNLIMVTTFSSHLARLKSIINIAQNKGRKVTMLGRSLDKYVSAGESAGIIDFKGIQRIRYRDKIRRFMKNVSKDPGKHVLIVTGHQGEPQAVLADLAYGRINYAFGDGDQVIFSCGVIPNEENQKNRDFLEEKLEAKHVRLFRDIHVSGHAAREELRDLLDMIRPKNIIPAHGFPEMMNHMLELAKDMGYDEKSVHMMGNGQSLIIDHG